jgi:CheY-like chemotaxis protein/two-component sensor histidine kinase
VEDFIRLEETLREADRRKDEFLATLAHELRNPLAPIRNSLEVLKRSDISREAIREAYAVMGRQLNQMVRLIDDLLDISRISRGKLIIQREQVELSEILRHALETSRPCVEEAGHKVTMKLLPGPVFLKADFVRLSQVFSNLLNNACKFTPAQGKLQVSVAVGDSEAIVSLMDNGIGIPRDKLRTIFEMFSQVDSSLNRTQGGLGIGLALVREVVQMHGGEVEAKSEGIGKGSEFIVRLPIMQEVTIPQPVVELHSGETGQYRILVVDDNRDSATTLSMLLKISGHETQTAHDGVEAVQVSEMFQPHVILLDIGLPKLNGYEACRRIREHSWGQQIVIIALTGWGQEDDRRKSREAGFNGHLVKPVEHAALSTLLTELVQSRPS